MTIYLDTCALTRLTDDLSQPRILAESEAVENILDLVATSEVRWLTSRFVFLEISRNPDAMKRAQLLPLLDMASGYIEFAPDIRSRAHDLQTHGLDLFDSFHLAACEVNSVDALITVDDRFLRRAARRPQEAVTQVVNPIDWLNRRRSWPPA